MRNGTLLRDSLKARFEDEASRHDEGARIRSRVAVSASRAHDSANFVSQANSARASLMQAYDRAQRAQNSGNRMAAYRAMQEARAIEGQAQYVAAMASTDFGDDKALFAAVSGDCFMSGVLG